MEGCPYKYITPDSWIYFEAWELYKAHGLPQGNGWLNESSKFLDAMDIIDQVFHEQNPEGDKCLTLI